MWWMDEADMEERLKYCPVCEILKPRNARHWWGSDATDDGWEEMCKLCFDKYVQATPMEQQAMKDKIRIRGQKKDRRL